MLPYSQLGRIFMLYILLLSLIAPILVYLIFVFYDHVSKPVIKYGLALLVVLAIVYSFVIYFNLPSRNALSLLMVNFALGVITAAAMSALTVAFNERGLVVPRLSAGLLLLILLVFIGGEWHSNFFLKPVAKSVNSTIQKSSKAPTFKKGVTPVALAPSTIKNRMNKNMSKVPNSQYYHLGEIQAQYYHGKPVYIAPVEFDTIFKYYSAGQSTPGYFIIDATSLSAEPRFVKTKLNYTNTSYFNRKAQRIMYRHYPEWLIADNSNPQLEIDENGTPYYVQTMYKPIPLSHRINYSKLHVVVMNAKTGKTKLYQLKNLPKWIDEGITTEVAHSMNTAFGEYQKGWISFTFIKNGVQRPTKENVISTFNNNGEVEYFNDFTNPRSEADSALGYSMINARTGKLTYYKTSGIMDSTGAAENANNNYKAQQWKAAMPVIYNISGHPTWVLSILDNTNAFRNYYYINAADQSIHATGDTANEALENYNQALIDGNASSASNTNSNSQKSLTGTVDRVTVTTSDSKSLLLFTLKDDTQHTIYTVQNDDYKSAALTQAGDKVSFKVQIQNNKAVGYVTSFKNSNLK